MLVESNNESAADVSVTQPAPAAIPTESESAAPPPSTTPEQTPYEKLTAMYEKIGRGEAEQEVEPEETEAEKEEPKSDSDAAEEEPEKTASEEEEEKDEKAKESDEKSDEKSDGDSEEELGKADFEKLRAQSEDRQFPDLAAIQAQFPRQSKALYEETAKWANEAKTSHESIQKIGGSEYIEPLSDIQKGIAENSITQFYEGVLKLGSIEAVAGVAGESIQMGLMNAPEWAKSDDVRLSELGKQVVANTDLTLAARFGGGVNAEFIEKVALLERAGWIEAVLKWKEEGFPDLDEFEELIEADKNPAMFQKLREGKAEAERQLAEARAQTGKEEKVKEVSISEEFTKETQIELETIFNDVVLATSVLRAVKSDTGDLKEEKAFLLARLNKDARSAMQALPDYQKLHEAYRRGEFKNPAYKKTLSKVINDALNEIQEDTFKAEKLVQKLYLKTRDASLVAAKPSAENAPLLRPTPAIERDSNKPMTKDEIYEEHLRRLTAVG